MAKYRVTLEWLKNNDATLGMNVLYFDNPDDAMTISQMGVEIDTQWWVALKPVTCNQVRLNAVYFKRVDSTPPGATFPYSTGLTTGSQGFEMLHQVVGMVFQFFDGIGGPEHRGRMYHYGSHTGHCNRNGPAPAGITAFNTCKGTWMTRYVTNGGTSGLTWLLRHRHATEGDTYTNISDIRLAPRLGVQRRRNFGVGF